MLYGHRDTDPLQQGLTAQLHREGCRAAPAVMQSPVPSHQVRPTSGTEPGKCEAQASSFKPHSTGSIILHISPGRPWLSWALQFS